MKHSIVVLFFVLLVAAGAADAQTFTRFLIPLHSPDIMGAYGSLWQVRTWMRYSGVEEALMVPAPFCYGVPCPQGLDVPPGWPALPVKVLSADAGPALVVYVESEHSDGFTFQSRARDLSRNSSSAGVEVPVVREDAMFLKPFYLLNVPITSSFRHTLRLYALPEPNVENPQVEVRYYSQPNAEGSTLDTTIRRLRTDRVVLRSRPAFDQFAPHPSFAQLGNLETLRELAGVENVWIEIVPLTAEVRFWGFLSVTSNLTQEVTVISPSR